MTIEAQVQALIDDAPQDGKTPQAVQQIAPALAEIASRLGVLEFYVLQNLEQRWQLTTLQNQQNREQEKTVVFAYANLKDATQASTDVSLIATPVPVIQLLFQLLTMTPVDSILFQGPGLSSSGTFEMQRQHLQQLVQLQLRHPVSPPPDIA